MEWVHSIADLWNRLTGLAGNLEVVTLLLFFALTWIVAAVFFGTSFLKFKFFGGEPPDEFISYFVPAFMFTFFVFGGLLALSIFTR